MGARSILLIRTEAGSRLAHPSKGNARVHVTHQCIRAIVPDNGSDLVLDRVLPLVSDNREHAERPYVGSEQTSRELQEQSSFRDSNDCL